MIGVKKMFVASLAILGSVNSFVPTKNQVKCSTTVDTLNGILVPEGTGGLSQDASGYKNLLVASGKSYDSMPPEQSSDNFYSNQESAVNSLNEQRQIYIDSSCQNFQEGPGCRAQYTGMTGC